MSTSTARMSGRRSAPAMLTSARKNCVAVLYLVARGASERVSREFLL